MSVYRLDISYEGSGFNGYARQSGQRTVQGVIEEALAVLLKTSPTTSGAGRTDSGVHAVGQVVSFEFDGNVDPGRLMRGLNGLVGPEVAVRGVELAPDGFNARFSATWRRYRYQIETAAAPDPLERRHVWHVGRSLDVEAMRSAAGSLLGEHDFSSFCRTLEGKSNIRRVTELELVEDETRITVWVQANAFCHQMVRSIVGLLYDVGRGFSAPSVVEEVIEARDRSRVATVAPPHGLTLWSVGYQ